MYSCWAFLTSTRPGLVGGRPPWARAVGYRYMPTHMLVSHSPSWRRLTKAPW